MLDVTNATEFSSFSSYGPTAITTASSTHGISSILIVVSVCVCLVFHIVLLRTVTSGISATSISTTSTASYYPTTTTTIIIASNTTTTTTSSNSASITTTTTPSTTIDTIFTSTAITIVPENPDLQNDSYGEIAKTGPNHGQTAAPDVPVPPTALAMEARKYLMKV